MRQSSIILLLLGLIYGDSFGQSGKTSLFIESLDRLSEHIQGTNILSEAQLESNYYVLQENIELLAEDHEAIQKSFGVVDLFENQNEPLFMSDNTKNGFNRSLANDGLNLQRNIILISQGLIDYAYSQSLITDFPDLFNGKYFKTAQYFPGYVQAPEDSLKIEKALIKCSYLLGQGSQPWSSIGNDHVVRPTGCYLAPGSISELIVPESLVGKGIKVRVGAHYWDLENKNKHKRLDRVSIVYDITNESTMIANPLGGGVYIEIPLGVDNGIVEVQLKNIVRSPFYSKKSFHQTTLDEWLEIERNHEAPWADFETDKFMMQVPTDWIYAFEDPKTLLDDWDKSMDAVSDLLGRPRVVDRHKNYLQFDVIIRGSAYHPGYPMSNTPYNPNESSDGIPKHNILKGPQFKQDIHFHELGHEVAISKFAGETEALVNFLYVPVLNKCFGYSLDEAFAMSFGPSYNYYQNKMNTVKTRLVAETFQEEVPRNICNCTKNEVRYQHRGYAHYVDIVELFGWEALEEFWKSEGKAADNGQPFPVNNQEQDDRILRMSKAAGTDLRPLFHFWGIHPKDPEKLAQSLADEDLKLSMKIKAKLKEYYDLIPKDNQEFIGFGQELYPDFLNYNGNQFDFGAGWYKAKSETYDGTTAKDIQNALSNIIKLYYGSDCIEFEEFLIPEFDINDHYCLADSSIILPNISINGIQGSWSLDSIKLDKVSVISYSFCPELTSCATEYEIEIEVTETNVEIIGNSLLCFGDTLVFESDSYHFEYAWTNEGVLLGQSNQIAFGGQGELILTAIDSLGCLAKDTLLISQQPKIDVSIMINDPICYGEYGSAIFYPTDSTQGQYFYSISGDSLMGGNYTVIAKDNAGCENSFEFEIVDPSPIIITLEDNNFAIEGGNPPYQITIDTLENIQVINVVDANGCMITEEFFYTSVNNLFDEFIVSPNPVKDYLQVDLGSDQYEINSLILFSLNGQPIKYFDPLDRNLDFSTIKSGTYFLIIATEEGKSLIKSIIVAK